MKGELDLIFWIQGEVLKLWLISRGGLFIKTGSVSDSIQQKTIIESALDMQKKESIWDFLLHGMLVTVFFFCLITYVSGKLCDSNQFWSSILERCENCSRCVHPDIVIRPCQGYTDTVCGPLSELNIDWTWLRNQGGHSSETNSKHGNIQKEMLETFKENFDEIRQHEKHMREKQKFFKRKHHKYSDESSEGKVIFDDDRFKLNKNCSKDMWSKLTLLKKHRTLEEKVSDDVMSMNGRNQNHLRESLAELKKLLRIHSNSRPSTRLHFDDEEAFDLLKKNKRKENETYDPNHLNFDENGILIKNFEFTKVEDSVKMEKLVDESKIADEFSTTEKFILDWQTVILGIAVSSCIIFFLVAAIYSMQHAKQWKKLRNYFDTDVEELQSWLSSKNGKNKIPPSGIYKTTTEVVHTEKGQCKYLERIIRMSNKNKFNFVTNNLYEKDNKLPSELKPLTKKTGI